MTLRTFSLPGANAQVRYVQRGSDDTTGDFKVADLEKAKNEARTMAHEDIFGGVDNWCDNHFSYDQRSSSLEFTSPCPTARANLSHFRPTCTLWARRRRPSNSMVLGRRIPRVVPVMPFKTLSSCSSKLDTLCSSVKQENEVCTDCINTRWSTFSSAGCHIADVVNYCVSSSPSPSPSLRQVCVFGW